MNIFDILHEQAKRYPNRVIWEDDEQTYSFSEVEQASGKIYRYLKNKGIGKEDIVAIKLPRSGRIPLVMLGILKVGAAFVTFGEHSPEEYISYQMEETKPKMVFDESDFKSAISLDYLKEHENFDEHDLAFVVYSTGSSGVFKGSMHEYGAIQKLIEHTRQNWENNKNPLMKPSDYRTWFNAGFYTMTAIIYVLDVIISNYYFYIVPYDKIDKLEDIGRILLDKKITDYIATTRDLEYVKALHSPYLKDLSISMDMNTFEFHPEYASFNCYGMSESLCVLACFRIDKQYDIVPIGKATDYIQMKIADQNDNPVKSGTIGEICFVPEYWRGYINQPERTKAAYYNGWFHTGDMAYVNDDGNMVIVGRKIDLAETENGYIVPSLIEIAFRKTFPDAKKCHVQIFEEHAKPIVCLYYCGKVEHTLQEIHKALKNVIPEYSMPTCLQKMDEFVYFPSGKLNRKAFCPPKTEEDC